MQNGTMNERLCGARVCHQNEFELSCSRRSDIFYCTFNGSRQSEIGIRSSTDRLQQH